MSTDTPAMPTDPHGLTGAYALDALDALEARRFEGHLATCPTCREEVAGFQAAATKLSLLTAEPAPPSLRESVLAEVDVTRQQPAPLSPRPAVVGPRQGWFAKAVGVAAAALLVTTLALTTMLARLDSRLEELETRSAAAIAILSGPDARATELSGTGTGRARFVLSPQQGQAVFLALDLPALSVDQAYELWLIGADGAEPAGLFRPNRDGDALLVTSADPLRFNAVGVTVEPRQGSRAPTSAPILQGRV